MVEKRGAADGGDQQAPEAKRPRSDDGGGVAGSGGGAPAAATGAKPALNLEALQKAKALLEKQRQLREKLKKLPQVAAAGAAPAPTAAALAASAPPLAPNLDPALVAAKAAKAVEIAARFGVQAAAPATLAAPGVRPVRPVFQPAAAPGPRPLRLDAQGREIDEHGNAVAPTARPSSSASLINQPREGIYPPPPPGSGGLSFPPPPPQQQQQQPPPPSGPRDEDFYDPSVASGHAGHRRRRGALQFVEEGTFSRQAELMRLKRRYGEHEFRRHLPPHLRRPPRGPAGPAERAPAPAAAAAGAAGGAAAAAGAGAAAAADGGGGLSGANLVPLGERAPELSEEQRLLRRLPEPLRQPPPGVEWWDRGLLRGGAYYFSDAPAAAAAGGADAAAAAAAADVIEAAPDGSGRAMALRAARITAYVEHPPPLEPPNAAPPPPPQPLKLTKRELKKMRTLRRQAREKEKQELMRQGLLEPPKPKVKLSNMVRVLGEQGALDPTAIEQEVRKQMRERAAAHDDRNLARMLTPAERREKRLRKLFDAGGGAAEASAGAGAGGAGAFAAVYRVEDLSHGQHRFKVDVNARENRMSGVMLVLPPAPAGGGKRGGDSGNGGANGPSFSLVVVEGGAKSLKRYHKLMLRRIDWAAPPPPPLGADGAEAMDEGGDDDDDDEGGDGGKQPNACHLVWEGSVTAPAFADFSKRDVADAAAARALLEARGVAHYWDAAAHFDASAAPLVALP